MREIVTGGTYRHFKGNLYKVEALALDCETLEPLVVYRALYGEEKLWVRKESEFLSEVDKEKYPDCPCKYRFTPVNE